MGEELRLGVEPGTTLTKTFEHRMELELDEMSMTVGDREFPPELLEGFEMSMSDEQTLVFVDEYVEMGDGRPLELRRTFDSLSNQSNESMSSPQGDDEKSSESTSELEGKCVVFTWDEDEEDYSVEFDETGGDDDLLEGLDEDTDLRWLLPEGEVEEGDSWEIDGAMMLHLLSPGGELSFVDEDGESEDSEMNDELDENMTGKITATLLGLKEIDDRSIALISLEAEITTEGDEEGEDDQGMAETTTVNIEMDLEGELRWDFDADHCAGMELSGDIETNVTAEGAFADQEYERVMSMRGSVSITLEVEAEG
jgi:hypothetical protein